MTLSCKLNAAIVKTFHNSPKSTIFAVTTILKSMIKEYLMPLIELLNEMSPYLLLGLLIAGILHEFVPQRIYREQLSGNNFRSVLLATLLGIPLPLCSCGVIPTAMSLRHSNASKGATTAFLISTPQTGVDSIMATASLMGIPFAIIRPLVALITALIGGTIVNIFNKEDEGNKESNTLSQEDRHKSLGKKIIGALNYGFIEMLQDIGKWIVIGLVVAAIITVLLPEDFFIQYSSNPILNMLLILLLSIPMYLCATGSIPIAAALMLKGLSPGAALVLLMAGPVTNMASILVINKVLGRKTLLIYLITIIIGAFTFGLIIDYILPSEWFTATISTHSAACCSIGTAWWKIASTIIFTILLTIAFTRVKHNHNKEENRSMREKFRIKGMMCNHCKANVEKSIATIEGVTNVTVDLSEGTAYVEGNFDPAKIIATIEEAGYEYIKE